jgi:hypothetical protein
MSGVLAGESLVPQPFRWICVDDIYADHPRHATDAPHAMLSDHAATRPPFSPAACLWAARHAMVGARHAIIIRH